MFFKVMHKLIATKLESVTFSGWLYHIFLHSDSRWNYSTNTVYTGSVTLLLNDTIQHYSTLDQPGMHLVTKVAIKVLLSNIYKYILCLPRLNNRKRLIADSEIRCCQVRLWIIFFLVWTAFFLSSLENRDRSDDDCEVFKLRYVAGSII